MAPHLAPPSVAFAASYIEALREGFGMGEMAAPTPADIERIAADFAAYLAARTDQTGTVRLPDGRDVPKVPFMLRWLVEDRSFIGEISIRRQLNEILRQTGGHVGYGVRPSRRRQGHGTHMLQLALPLCRRYCGPRILITCLDANIASARIIEANGGVLEDIIPDPFGRGPKRRYWIDLA